MPRLGVAAIDGSQVLERDAAVRDLVEKIGGAARDTGPDAGNRIFSTAQAVPGPHGGCRVAPWPSAATDEIIDAKRQPGCSVHSTTS